MGTSINALISIVTQARTKAQKQLVNVSIKRLSKHKSERKTKRIFFLSLNTCARACVEIIPSEIESSTSTCLSNVWPNQPRTQRFSPFPPLSLEGKERDPGYEVEAKSLAPTSME